MWEGCWDFGLPAASSGFVFNYIKFGGLLAFFLGKQVPCGMIGARTPDGLPSISLRG